MIGPLDQAAVDTVRFLSVDAVERAASGHPGLPLGAAPMATVLWTRFLRHNPAHPDWFDRDRFILSAGHGSMLYYSLLHLTGYDLPLEELKRFRRWGSRTPGHPERGVTPGVEMTTGPLGQGFANAVGQAMAEAHLAARYNRPGFEIVNHRTYVLASDGDLMEGVAAEAASLAGHLKLGKLICLYDDNRVTLSASTRLAFTEYRLLRFKAYGWHVLAVEDGNDLAALDRALRAARRERARPTLIAVRTHIGYGSPNKQDTFEAHGAPLGADEVRLTKRALGWPEEPPFRIPDDVGAYFRLALEKGAKAEKSWAVRFARYEEAHPHEARELKRRMAGERPAGWSEALPVFPPDPGGMPTRKASGLAMQEMARVLPELLGGSADLDPSTHTALTGLGDFEPPGEDTGDTQGSAGGGWSYAGRNLHFGVREHAMGAILNGLFAHGALLPYGATFLTFSDYMRPAIRLGSMMRAHVVYVFTHDSIGLGEDGPTHQPIEHLASLRAIPRLWVIRPCDANETVEAWRVAVEAWDRPVALILSRQSVPVLDRTVFAPASGLGRGAYVLADPEQGEPDVILIASGSEVGLIVQARDELRRRGIKVRLVSMPCWELFDAQSPDYRESVLPASKTARVVVEAGSSQGWHRFAGPGGGVIALDRFGESAPGVEVMRELGFTSERVCACALSILETGHAPLET